ncbi:MAG TPA: YggT family protein [Acidiferrobacter sp.]|nr:YggT family protein [Acidiferrobacter sp.]
MSYLSQAFTFLIETLFGMYILLVLLRFLLQLTHADFYNPFSQFIVRMTNAPLLPLRRLIPGFFGIDFASAVLLIVLEAIEVTLTTLIQVGAVHPGGVFILSFAELIQLTLYILIGAVLLRVLVSWISPYGEHPLTDLAVHLTEPFMRPARRLLPLISGIDLSPVLVIIALELIEILVVQPLQQLGMSLLA